MKYLYFYCSNGAKKIPLQGIFDIKVSLIYAFYAMIDFRNLIPQIRLIAALVVLVIIFNTILMVFDILDGEEVILSMQSQTMLGIGCDLFVYTLYSIMAVLLAQQLPASSALRRTLYFGIGAFVFVILNDLVTFRLVGTWFNWALTDLSGAQIVCMVLDIVSCVLLTLFYGRIASLLPSSGARTALWCLAAYQVIGYILVEFATYQVLSINSFSFLTADDASDLVIGLDWIIDGALQVWLLLSLPKILRMRHLTAE